MLCPGCDGRNPRQVKRVRTGQAWDERRHVLQIHFTRAHGEGVERNDLCLLGRNYDDPEIGRHRADRASANDALTKLHRATAIRADGIGAGERGRRGEARLASSLVDVFEPKTQIARPRCARTARR